MRRWRFEALLAALAAGILGFANIARAEGEYVWTGTGRRERMKNRIWNLAGLMAAALFAATAHAVTPVAVWDGDFTTMTQGKYTLSENGNTKTDTYLQISGDNGILVTSTEALNVFTVIMRCSGLNLASANNQVLFTSYGADASTAAGINDNMTGVNLPANNAVCRGIAAGADWNNGATQGSVPENYTTLIYNHQQTNGTYAYALGPTSDVDNTVVRTTLYSVVGLRSSGTTYKGCAIGGLRGATSETLLPATGLKITAIAVFSGTLTEAEMKGYLFPSQTQIINVDADTTVSAINLQIDAVNYKETVVSVADGVKITVDEAFGNVSVSSEGSIMLLAESQPDESYFSNADFSGIKGGLLRSWVGPDVIGYNFCSDGYNTSYYYGGAANTSSALAKGIWYANGQSKNGSAKVYSEDGLTVLTWSAPSVWSEQAGISSGTFIQGYLDDNGGNPQVDVSALPFEKYDVIIYCSAGSDGAKFQAKYVNGQYYKWDDEKGETVVAEGAGDNWGSAKTSSTPVYGTNCIRVNNLTGPLTIRGGQRNSTLGGGCISAIQIIPAEVEIDATEGFTPDATRLENIRKDYRDVTIKGSGENGATIDYGDTTTAFSSHVVFDGGAHTLKYSYNGNNGVGTLGANSDKPIFETTNGATLNFYQHDLSGWLGDATLEVPVTNIKIGSGTLMNLYPYGSGTTYYQGRYTIEPGGTITSCFADGASPSNFRLNGGAVQGYEQIYVPASDPGSAPAVFNGCEGNTGLHLPTDNTQGLGFYVGENSTLDFDLAITSSGSDQPIGKWGEGTLNLNGDMSGYLGTLTIHAGTVTVATATTLASVVNSATLAFAYGENGSSLPTFTSYSGSGHVQIDVSALTPVSGETYVLMPNAALDMSKVELIGLIDSNFHARLTEEGVVLTDYTGFDPTWTGASGVWSASQFDGREGDTTDSSVIFAESAGNATVAVTVNGEKNVASLSFIASDTEYTLTGNKITATGAINVSGASPVAISTPIEANAVSLGADTSLTFSTTDLTIPDGGLSGSGTLIFDHGVGNEFTMSSGNTSFTGDVIIESGTVKMGNGTSFGPVNTPGTITVKNAAVLDMNGAISGEYYDQKCSVILENGATLTASQYTSAHGGRWSALTTLTLNGNANVDASMANVVMGRTLHYTYCNINLNGNTLTKTGNNDFIISHCSINGAGEFRIKEGSVSIYKNYYGGEAGRCTDGKIVIDPGATFIMNDGSNFSANMLELNGSVTRANENSTFTVTGNLSGSGTTPMLTLADGATLKPQSATDGLTVNESLTLSGNINVDISGLDLTGKFRLPIITSPTQITTDKVTAFTRGANSENWQLYSEEVSTGTYEFGVKIESIPWTGESGVWTDTGFDGGDDNYLNDGSQKVIFPDDDDSSTTPLEVTVDGEKNVDTLGFTADNRAVTIEGDAIAAGTVTKSGKGLATVKSALTISTEVIVIDGILLLNPTDEAIDTSGMDDGTLVVYVAAGTTNTISVAITAAKLIKLGPGTLALSNANNISGGTSLEEGQIISSIEPANPVAIAEGATFTLRDCVWENGDRFTGGGSAILELDDTSTAPNKITHTATLSMFDGVVRLKSVNTTYGYYYQCNLNPTGNPNFHPSVCPGLEVAGYVHLGNRYYKGTSASPGGKLKVRDLSGNGTISSEWTSGDYKYEVESKQTKDTEFSGVFRSSDSRAVSLSVIGAGSSQINALILSGANVCTGNSKLDISSYGKVIFSESGSWANGAVTVNDSGWLEVRNPAAMTSATLTLNDGATVVIPLVEEAVVTLAAATINASGSVYVDVSKTGITSTSDPITVMTGYAGEDVASLKPIGCAGKFSLESGTVVFTPSQAEPWTGGSATWKSNRIVSSDESESIDYADLAAVAFGAIGDPATEATITIEGTRTPESITFNGGEGKTYKLAGGALRPEGVMTIAGGTVAVNTEAVLSEVVGDGELAIGDDGVVAITSASSISADTALSGTGTLILDGFLPDAPLLEKLSDAAWQGTLWIKNIGESDAGETGKVTVLLESLDQYGNANSAVKFTNVRAYAGSADCLWTLILEDEGDKFAWYNNNGDSDNEIKVAKLKGSGTFYDYGYAECRERMTFTDASGFVGSISVAGKRIGLGAQNDLDDTEANAGTIKAAAANEFAIAVGKVWIANHIVVEGTVNMAAYSLMAGTVNGNGTIKCAALLNVAPAFGENWTGTVELPVINANGLNLNVYGRRGSKIVINGITGGYLNAETGYEVAPDLVLAGDLRLTDASLRAYTFQTISGTGNFVFDTEAAITSIAFARIAADYTGTVTNNTSATLSIGEIALDMAPTMGEVVLKAGGDGTIANTTSTVDGTTYTIFQQASDRNMYMAVASITEDSTTVYYKTAQEALDTLTGNATIASIVPEPPFSWDSLTGLSVPETVTKIDMGTMRDFANWSFDSSTEVAVRTTLDELVAGEISVRNVPDGVSAITVYVYGSDEVFGNIAISEHQGSLAIENMDVVGTYSTYLNDTVSPSAGLTGNANVTWQSFNLRHAVTEADSVHFLFANTDTDFAEITEVVKLSSITVNWGSGTDKNADFGGSDEGTPITTEPYLVVTTPQNVIVAISAKGDSVWTVSGSTTFTFNGDVLASDARYRIQFAESVDGLAIGGVFSDAKIARCNCVWHSSSHAVDEDTACSAGNTFSVNTQIAVGIVYGVNYRKTIASDVDWSDEKPEGWVDGPAPYIAITAAENTTPTFTFDIDVTAGVLTADGTVTIKKSNDVAATFGSIVAKNGAVLHNFGNSQVSVTEGTVTLVDWADAALSSPDADAAIRFTGDSTISTLPFITESANVKGGIILAQAFTGELFQPVGNKAFVGFEDGAEVTVTRMVLGNQGGVVQNYSQTGGTITINGDGSVASNQTAPLLIGHWNSTVVYDMTGGTIDMPNGAVRLAWGNSNDSSGSATWNIGGGEGEATVNTKGIRAGNERERAAMPGTLNLKPNGVLTLREDGIQFLSENATLNLMGGKIVAADNMEIANAKANGTVLAEGTTTILDTRENKVTLSAALTGSGTLVKRGAGMLILDCNLDNFTGKIVVDAGTLVFRNTHNAGAGMIEFAEGTQLGLVDSFANDGKFTIDRTTVIWDDEKTAIKLYNSDMTASSSKITAVDNGDGTWTYSWAPMVLAWADFDFNTDNYGPFINYGLLNNNSIKNSGTGGTDGDLKEDGFTVAQSLDPETGGLYMRVHPYKGYSYPTEWSAAIYATLPALEDNVLVMFGSAGGGFLALIRGSTENEIKLVWGKSSEQSYTTLAAMKVKAATIAHHLVVFSKNSSYVNVYIDGVHVVQYPASGLSIGSGFQVGSIFNGDKTNGLTRPASDDPAEIGMIKVWQQQIGATMSASLAEKYPFISPGRKSERTLDSSTGDNDWYVNDWYVPAGGVWINTINGEAAEGDDGSLPLEDADVTITSGGDCEQWLDVVLNEDNGQNQNAVVGDLVFTGTQPITVRKSIGGFALEPSGIMSNATDLTVHVGAIEMNTVPLYMSEDATLHFDPTDCLIGLRTAGRIDLTGVCEEFLDSTSNPRVTCAPTSNSGIIRFKSFGYDSTKRCYYMETEAAREAMNVYVRTVGDGVVDGDTEVYYLDGDTEVSTLPIDGDVLHFTEDSAPTNTIAPSLVVGGFSIPAGITLVLTNELSVAVSGEGNILMDGARPKASEGAAATALKDSAKWKGLLEIRGVNFGNTSLDNFGNENSKLRLSGCSITPQGGSECAFKLELVDGDYGYGLKYNYATTAGIVTQIKSLTGDGTFVSPGTTEASAKVATFKVLDASDFTGVISNTVPEEATGGLLFEIGSDEATAAEGVLIASDGELTIADAIYASTNFTVRGTLKVTGEQAVVSTGNVSFDGGTLVLPEGAYPMFLAPVEVTANGLTVDLADILSEGGVQVMRVSDSDYLPSKDNIIIKGNAAGKILVKDGDGKGWSLRRGGFYLHIR